MHNFSHETFSKSGSSLLEPHADPTALTTQIWGKKINSEREERNLKIWSIKFLLFGYRSSVKAFDFGADATQEAAAADRKLVGLRRGRSLSVGLAACLAKEGQQPSPKSQTTSQFLKITRPQIDPFFSFPGFVFGVSGLQVCSKA
jgi:hypothetical protein